jgi:hypothetical protein
MLHPYLHIDRVYAREKEDLADVYKGEIILGTMHDGGLCQLYFKELAEKEEVDLGR